MDIRIPAAAVTAAFLVGAGLVLGRLAARRRTRRRMAVHRALGRAGEERALDLLREAGYRVLDTQVRGRGRIRVDGRPVTFEVRADALVRRWFRRYVAEFKGGAEAASPANRATRRQLLEYARVFGVRGILLVDAAAGRIRRVEFPGTPGG